MVFFLRKKSCQKTWTQFPSSFEGIQVNCCKFTTCEAFGVEPEKASASNMYNKDTHYVKYV